MQFRPIVVSIFFKTCVKDHGETLQQIATKKDLIIMYQALLFAVCNISVYFNKLANDF